MLVKLILTGQKGSNMRRKLHLSIRLILLLVLIFISLQTKPNSINRNLHLINNSPKSYPVSVIAKLSIERGNVNEGVYALIKRSESNGSYKLGPTNLIDSILIIENGLKCYYFNIKSIRLKLLSENQGVTVEHDFGNYLTWKGVGRLEVDNIAVEGEIVKPLNTKPAFSIESESKSCEYYLF